MVEYIKEDIQEVMQITGLSQEKATRLFESVAKDIDDGTDDELCSYDVIEVIKMEHKAKESGASKIYAQKEKTPISKEKPKREIKLDDVKVDFLKSLKDLLSTLETNGKISNIFVVNPQKEISFDIGADNYSISLIKHRAGKKKK